MSKVSVLMPVYRTKEEYLRVAIESVLNQTFKDFEFIILDDCPTDSREKVIQSYDDARIKYVKNKQNLGISKSRNKLIDMAKGEYLAIMDHDDICLPERFAKEVDVLDKNKDIGVVGCAIHKIESKKDMINPQNDADIKKALMMKCVVTHPSAMIRKSILEEHNIRYNEYYSPAEDYKLWCQLIPLTQFYNIPEVLFLYRDWEDNTSHRQKTKMDMVTTEIWAENETKYPELWHKFKAMQNINIVTIRLFNIIPLIKIIEKGRRKQVRLFDFIPLLKIKHSVKLR